MFDLSIDVKFVSVCIDNKHAMAKNVLLNKVVWQPQQIIGSLAPA